MDYYGIPIGSDELTHYGRLGMKWGQHIFGDDPRWGANRRSGSLNSSKTSEAKAARKQERKKRKALKREVSSKLTEAMKLYARPAFTKKSLHEKELAFEKKIDSITKWAMEDSERLAVFGDMVYLSNQQIQQIQQMQQAGQQFQGQMLRDMEQATRRKIKELMWQQRNQQMQQQEMQRMMQQQMTMMKQMM